MNNQTRRVVTNDYLAVTELAGDKVTQEQVERICHRYSWAGRYCRGKDVIEAACGTGQGLGYLAGLAKSLQAGDYSEEILKITRKYYGDRINLRQFDAQQMPLQDRSLDVVILFEAIYYLPDASRFVEECRRVLRPGGHVLVATANKDLFDFNPSPHTCRYYGVVELNALFGSRGFDVRCFGYWPVGQASLRQQVLRPVKMMAARLGLIPKSMAAKKLLKRLVFGKLVPMPAEIREGMAPYVEPTPLPSGRPDTGHKVIYCVAELKREGRRAQS